MATPCIAQTAFRFQRNSKLVVARFDTPHASSDGGAVLLKAIDAQIRLSERLVRCLRDRRQPSKVQHSLVDLLRQRLFGLACGYPDCNDAARLADDPIHKLLLDRDPLSGPTLGSQPTLSRFENAVGPMALYRLADALADTVLEFHQRRLRGRVTRVTIDLDQTDDPTHGQQELALFNGFYDPWCYLPLIATVTFNDEPAQYAVAALLRPGRRASGREVVAVLRRLLAKVRAAFPKAQLCVRLDAGFAGPVLLDFLAAAGIEYVVALQGYAPLAKRVRRLQGRARMLARASGQSVRLFGETRYAAKSWSHKRRVIMKAEVLRYPGRPSKDNPRFVVTNLPQPPEVVYTIYCGRGDMENRLKELQHGLAMDRTSCSRFAANQLRLLLALAAFVLFQVLQSHAGRTDCAEAQVSTLRERMIKLAAWVTRSARRIVLHLPLNAPWLRTWRQIAAAVAAAP